MTKRVCTYTGCNKLTKRTTYCDGHYRQFRAGEQLKPLREYGKRIGRLKKNSGGYTYRMYKGHPNANKAGFVLEHVRVMTEMLNRTLRPGENVHHKNGIRDDNRPENLELWTSSQPSGQRVEDLLEWAREIIRLYGDEVDES